MSTSERIQDLCRNDKNQTLQCAGRGMLGRGARCKPLLWLWLWGFPAVPTAAWWGCSNGARLNQVKAASSDQLFQGKTASVNTWINPASSSYECRRKREGKEKTEGRRKKNDGLDSSHVCRRLRRALGSEIHGLQEKTGRCWSYHLKRWLRGIILGTNPHLHPRQPQFRPDFLGLLWAEQGVMWLNCHVIFWVGKSKKKNAEFLFKLHWRVRCILQNKQTLTQMGKLTFFLSIVN